MTAEPARPPATPPSTLPDRLRSAGLAVLVLGLLAALLIYALTPPEVDAAAGIGNSRLDDYNIERIGGKAAVYAAHFNRWLDGLWHGRTLSYTVAVLALAVALACWWASRLAALPVHADHEHDGPG